MEDLKSENGMEQTEAEEPVIEQRPSTKYGRTAYQQQMQEELAAQEKRNDGESYQQNNWQEQNSYSQQIYSAYTPYENVKPEVKKIFARVLMVVILLTQVLGIVFNTIASRVYSMGDTVEEIIDALMLITQEPSMVVLSVIGDVLFWMTVAFMILDIIQLRNAGKKITGAILFAIFLRPAYFIWRAHLLGEKKVIPIIYAVVTYIISIAQYVVILYASMEMVMRTMY
ncbi:MAG: hypothetical protein IKW08_09235 [Roseburia sp.]|nr:hypothetical protein [Roseburia sp.]